MVEVALLGAPGSRKTDLAWAVNDAYFDDEKHDHFCVVDAYIENLNHLDIATGVFGDMYVNHWIHFMRETREAEKRKEGVPFMITCGTILDTLAHAEVFMGQFDDAMPSKEMRANFEASNLAYNQLLVWGATRFKKHLTYMLPLKEAKGDQQAYDRMVHDNLFDINVKAKLNIPILDGDLSKQVERIKQDIQSAVSADGDTQG